MKKLTLLTLILCISFTSVLGYAVTQYLLSTQVNEEVSVGSTIEWQEGIDITLANKDSGNLTYFTIEESDTDRHYLTYEYNYIIIPGYTITANTSSEDIVISNVATTDSVISITFHLKQENSYTQGDTLSITFNFELEEITLGTWSVSNPLNINTASADDLMDIGFTYGEANDIEQYTGTLDETNLHTVFYIADYETRFEDYITWGIIVFQ